MNVKKVYNWWVEGSSYSAELQAVISKATGLGYTRPSAATLAILDAFIVYLKTNNLWTLLDCLYVRLYLDTNASNFSLLNLKDSNNYQTVLSGTPPTYGLFGWTGNAASAYLNNVFVPSTNGVNFVQNSASMIIGVISSLPNGNYTFGGANDVGLTKRLLIEPFSGTNYFEVNTGTAGSNTPTYVDSAGLWVASRTASNLTTFYKDGTSITTSSAASTGVTAKAVYEMAENNNGSATLFNPHTDALFALGAGLSSGQVTTLFTGWNNYLKSMLMNGAQSVTFPIPSSDASFTTFNTARVSVKTKTTQPTVYNASGVYKIYGNPTTTSHIGGCIIGGRYIYHTPWNSTHFVKTDTFARTSANFGSALGSNAGLTGACTFGPNDRYILMGPHDALAAAVIDTNDDSVKWYDTTGEIADPTTGNLTGATKWDGVLLSPDRSVIIGVPFNSTKVFVFNTTTRAITFINLASPVVNGWIGGGQYPNANKILCVPYNATNALIIDCTNLTVDETTITGFPASTKKWSGGRVGTDGTTMFFMPHSYNKVGGINTNDNTKITEFGSFTVGGSDAYIGGAMGLDGNIYQFPSSETKILIIDTTNRTTTQSAASIVTNGVVGACMNAYGEIWAMSAKLESLNYTLPTTIDTNYCSSHYINHNGY